MGISVHPTRWSVSKTLEQAAMRLAKLALASCDAEQRHFVASSGRVLYPTRFNTESLIRKALTPWNVDWPGYGRTEEFPEGITLVDLFERAADIVLADEGDDAEAVALLVDCYNAIAEREDGASEVESAVNVLATADPGSLWWLGVTQALPNHPQTPGSPGWVAAEAAGNPHESEANPFTGLRST